MDFSWEKERFIPRPHADTTEAIKMCRVIVHDIDIYSQIHLVLLEEWRIYILQVA